jgi:hypothetical protein
MADHTDGPGPAEPFHEPAVRALLAADLADPHHQKHFIRTNVSIVS